MNCVAKMLISLSLLGVLGAPGGAAAADAPATAGATAPGTPAAGRPAPGTPAAQSSAQIEAGEPRADTSSPPAAPAPAPAPVANDRSKVRTTTAHSGTSPKGNDRVDLGTATVTGDREQPKVMYIVPWKRSDIGDLSGKPMNSLLDEALAPVDRDEFKREVAYYGAVRATRPENGPAKPGSGPPADNQGEK
jgi:hypothetical protein